MLVPESSNQSLKTVDKGFYVIKLKTTMILKALQGLWPGVDRLKSAHYLHDNIPRTGEEIGVNKDKTVFISYLGQPNGRGSEHLWQLKVHQKFAVRWSSIAKQLEATLEEESSSIVATKNRFATNKTIDLDGIRYRSQAEVAIAKAFEERGITFFVNARSRIPSRNGKYVTKEADFLVLCSNGIAILEVDGSQHNESREADYKRDRLFQKQGIRTIRFTAKECYHNSTEVVDEFLDLFT